MCIGVGTNTVIVCSYRTLIIVSIHFEQNICGFSLTIIVQPRDIGLLVYCWSYLTLMPIEHALNYEFLICTLNETRGEALRGWPFNAEIRCQGIVPLLDNMFLALSWQYQAVESTVCTCSSQRQKKAQGSEPRWHCLPAKSPEQVRHSPWRHVKNVSEGDKKKRLQSPNQDSLSFLLQAFIKVWEPRLGCSGPVNGISIFLLYIAAVTMQTLDWLMLVFLSAVLCGVCALSVWDVLALLPFRELKF